jgi:hypothetical protein
LGGGYDEDHPLKISLPLPHQHSIDTSISGISDRTSYSTDGNTFLFPTVDSNVTKSSALSPAMAKPVKITGYINKSARYTGSVTRRLFELKTVDSVSTLTYFNTDETVRDSVDLLASSIISAAGSKGFKIVIDCKASYPWVLRFEDDKERDYWLSALCYHKAYGLAQVPAMHRGFLLKRGHIVKSWKERYFVLESSPLGTALTYYAQQSDDPPFGDTMKGKLDLKNYDILDPEDVMSVGGGEDGGGGVEVGQEDGRGRLDSDAQLVIVLQENLKNHSNYARYRLKCASAEDKGQWEAAIRAHKAYVAARNKSEEGEEAESKRDKSA